MSTFTIKFGEAEVTVTATQADGASTWTLSATGYESLDNYFSFDGTTSTFTVRQAAIDAGLTVVTGPDTTINLAVEQGVSINNHELTGTVTTVYDWAAAVGGGFTYYSSQLGYTNGKTGNKFSGGQKNQLTITNTLQDKFTITGTFPDTVTATDMLNYFTPNALSDTAYTVTPTDTFVRMCSR